MMRFGPSIEHITFPTPSRYATCYATDAGFLFSWCKTNKPDLKIEERLKDLMMASVINIIFYALINVILKNNFYLNFKI